MKKRRLQKRIRSNAVTPDPAVSPAVPGGEFNPDDLLSIEQVAARLRTDVAWVREKIRRRCPNPLPVYNLGRHLLFSWPAVCEWIRNAPRPVHAAHRRRKQAVKSNHENSFK
jgi:hypothetical protein